MTHYAELHARVHSMGQLGEVVSAMRGVAAARVQQSKRQLDSVRLYADMVAGAISEVLPLLPPDSGAPPAAGGASALVLIGAEHGFAGAFSERLLDRAQALGGQPLWLLVGSRCQRAALARGLRPAWGAKMVSQLANAATLADQVGAQLYQLLHARRVTRVALCYARPREHDGSEVVCEQVLPLDYSRFRAADAALPPLLNLLPTALLERLAGEYLFAQLNEAIAHSFAAENLARLQTMSSAHEHLERRLRLLAPQERQARQAEITAEILELAGGAFP